MKMIKTIWKGAEEERVHIKDEGYMAELHFVPDQEILLPEKALEKLRDQLLTKRLVVIDINNCTGIGEECHSHKLEINSQSDKKEEYKKTRKRRFRTEESSITDSISINEGVCE